MKLFRGALEISWHGGLKTQVRKLCADGHPLEAIKYVRDKRGWTLAKAKKYVDDIRKLLVKTN